MRHLAQSIWRSATVYCRGLTPIIIRPNKRESIRQLLAPCEDATFRCKFCCASSRSRRAFVVILAGTLAPAMRNNRSATFIAVPSDPSASISSHPFQDSTQDWSNTVRTSSSSCSIDKQIPATSFLASGDGPPPQNRLCASWFAGA